LSDTFQHEATVKRSPHVSHGLLVPGIQILEETSYAISAAVHIGVAGWTKHASGGEISIMCEEALDIHV
jgi:hypothetical protein